MTGTAQRWRRYGHDRLYVTGSDGIKLGYRDLLTGIDHMDVASRADEFAEVVAAWTRSPESANARPTPDRAPTPEVAADRVAEPVPGWTAEATPDPVSAASSAHDDGEPVVDQDLGSRRAGSMAREQAIALRKAAPVRTLVARALGVHTEERAWRIGADGEELVAAQLDKLARRDSRWRFVHAIPIGVEGADIDHLAIGPAGVFTLNAKHHPGARIWVGGNAFLVNGQRQPYIRNARHEAHRASRLLSAACGFPVVVTGVVVPVGAGDLTIKSPPDDVHVINRMRLRDWLGGLPDALSANDIDAIYGSARRSTTWRPLNPGLAPQVPVLQERSQVLRARTAVDGLRSNVRTSGTGRPPPAGGLRRGSRPDADPWGQPS